MSPGPRSWWRSQAWAFFCPFMNAWPAVEGDVGQFRAHSGVWVCVPLGTPQGGCQVSALPPPTHLGRLVILPLTLPTAQRQCLTFQMCISFIDISLFLKGLELY